jgi:phosphohistidine phosphatase
MGEFFRQEKVSPDLILSSCAMRARETTDIIVRSAKLRSDLRFDERIYEASVDRLLEVVTQIEKDVRSALIVGHNPGLEELLSALTAQSETMPTATLAKITFKSANWNNTVKGGALEWVVRPKELERI